MIKAIIFDLDGVLVDATEWHYEALNEALSFFGYKISRDEHVSSYNGLPTTEKLKLLSQQYGFPFGLHALVGRLKRKITDEKIRLNCRPSHSKQLMLYYLKKKGYTLAVCSNAQRLSVLSMLKMSQIDDYFDLVIGNDEGYSPKPSPEIYLGAFSRLHIDPKEAIIVEDAPHGIKAAKASGANVITVGGYEDVTLSLFEEYL